jgi:hypothetical protein
MDSLIKLSQKLRALSKEQWALIVAVATVLSYAALYFAYFQFYVSFGLRPADVGLTRLRLLEESLIALLFLPFALILKHWILALVIVTVVAILTILWGRFRKRPWRDSVAALLMIFAITLVPLTLYGYFQLVGDARDRGDAVRRNGEIVVTWVNRRYSIYLPYLDVQAIPVDVVEPTNLIGPTLISGCILYLGQSDDQAVLYDVRRRTVIRFSVSDVVLVTHPALKNYPGQSLPKRCLAEEGNAVR